MKGLLQSGGPAGRRLNKSKLKLGEIDSNITLTSNKYEINISLTFTNLYNTILKDGDKIIIRRVILAKFNDELNVFTDPIVDILNHIFFFRI